MARNIFDVDQIRTENLLYNMLQHHGLNGYIISFGINRKMRRCRVNLGLNIGYDFRPSLPYDGQTIQEIDNLHDQMEAVANDVKSKQERQI